MWSSSVADRFLPADPPEFFPLLARRQPLKQLGGVEPTGSIQAFACPISSTEDLRDFLTFFFSAASSMPGPCSAKAAADQPGVIVVTGKHDVQFNKIPLQFPSSRLLFLELACVGQGADMRQCGVGNPTNLGRFINSASFEVTVAFARPREAPFQARDKAPHSVILASVHNLNDPTPRQGFTVTVWEIPSTRWIGGQSIQPPVRKMLSTVTDAHGCATAMLPQEKVTPHEYVSQKGYVVSVQDPDSGEMLVTDLLRLRRMAVQDESPSVAGAMADAMRVSLATDRAVYAPGDSIAVLGVVATVGTICPGGRPSSMCAPSAVQAEPGVLLAAEIIWKLALGPHQDEVCTMHLWPVSTFGMFSANLSVPGNASFGPVPSLSLFWVKEPLAQVLNSCQEWRQYRLHHRDPVLRSTAFDILVADPRPPTAIIKFMHLPAFLQPDQPLKMAVLLETYTGIPLQNHELKVEISKRQRIGRLPVLDMMEPETSDAGQAKSTELARLTNESGVWSQAVMFGKQSEVEVVRNWGGGGGGGGGGVPYWDPYWKGILLLGGGGGLFFGGSLILVHCQVAWTPKLGDELSIKVSSRGPTGELLVQSQKLPVRLSPYEVEVRTSAGLAGVQGPLPEQDFTVWVELKANFPDESWGISTGPDAAKVFLIPFPVDASGIHGQGSCMDWVHVQARKQALTPDSFVDERVCRGGISLHSPAVCQFRMPQVDKYVLVAQIDVRGKAGMQLIYGCTFVGQTKKDWSRRPVASPNIFERFEVKPSKPAYEIGETIHLEVWNPLAVKSRLLILWGDQPAVLNVESVTSSQTVSLGTMMEQDCPMPLCQVHIFACSTEDPSSIFKSVPRSVHYPDAAPIWAHQEVTLNISRSHSSLKVHVAPHAAITAPGSDVEIEVKVSGEGQSEMAVMVVDKAWLDLRPSKLQDPLKAFEPSKVEARGPRWHVVTSLDGISSGQSLHKAGLF